MDEVFGAAAMAIVSGDHDELRALLDASPELASLRSSVSHPTLLQLVACEAANLPDPVESARVLVQAGAPLDEPLIAAAGCGSTDIVDLLLDHGADIDTGARWSPLDEAIYWNLLDVARHLLERGATIRALSTAAGLGHPAAVDRFFDDGTLQADAGPIGSPFVDTVPVDRANDPQDIIDHAFVMAANSGQQAVAATLLARGAEINATPPGYHWHGAAIHAAAWRGDEHLVRWLLDAGADPAMRDGMVDSDAAGWARHHGHDHLLDLLS